MTTIRVKKNRDYFATSNVPFNDKRLSWEARGMMGYLLSKPDNWKVMFNDLVKQSPAQAHKVRRILRELQEFGYLKRKRKRGEGGKFYWQSTIYETPDMPEDDEDAEEPEPYRGNPHMDDPHMDDPHMENREIYQVQNETSTESLSTEKKVNPQADMVGVLSEVTGLDYNIQENVGRLAKRAKSLLRAKYTPEQVQEHYSPGGWWYKHDWRGQKNQRPTPEQVAETILQATNPVASEPARKFSQVY